MSIVKKPTMEALKTVFLCLAILIAAYSLNLAVQAGHDAKASKKSAEVATHEAKVITYELKVAEYKRAVADRNRALGACSSSKALRNLLDDIDTIVVGAVTNPTDQSILNFSARIKAYTGSNPNCENIPPKPVKPTPSPGVNS